MRVIIAGGGTGGHLFPGLAIAEEFKKRNEMTEVIFVGTERGIEARVIPKEGFPIKFLRAEGMIGVSVYEKIKALAKTGLGFFDSYKIIKLVSPDIMIGVGGYASGAIMLIAASMSIPTMVLEQNCIPGFTNRILGKFVSTVCLTYQESIPFFPKEKSFLTGNPVRMHILTGNRESACRFFSLEENLFTVFVFGGSLGARSINKAVIESFQHLHDLKDKIQFLHQTGSDDYENVRNAFREFGFKGMISPFIYQMGEAYAVSDIVISRAGATTLAELTSLGKPAVLIPYPHATGQHQELNARKLSDMGAAKMILDSELSGKSLAHAIKELYENDAMRTEMQKHSRVLGKPEAGEKVVDIAMSLIKKDRNEKRKN
jgi:UDP-N-acetylglucosamine--N-acetylmuramyl-(pentapeptide) pyrophosphoryl-undecaprenol N-acetylglucosamine transferase